MDKSAHDLAVRLLLEASPGAPTLSALPAGSRPNTVAEALAIQESLVARSAETVAGWKVATSSNGEVTYGAIFAADCYESPAVVPLSRYPTMGVEGEVAFRFNENLPSGAVMRREEIAEVLTPFPAIEIVATRFVDYAAAPSLDRLADRMSNGGFVVGAVQGHPLDLSQLHVQLLKNADPVVDQTGGHSRGDPLLPVLEFINFVRPTRDFSAGQFITAGTFTGLRHGRAGEVWEVEFGGLGSARLTIV